MRLASLGAVEIQNLKQQYDFWLNKKSKEAELFVADFNKYRTKRNELLSSYEKEMLELHDYSSSLKNIVDGVHSASYKMKTTRSGTVIPVIPRSHFPATDLLENEKLLKHTLRLANKREEDDQHERTIRDRANLTMKAIKGPETQLYLQGGAGSALRKSNSVRPSTAPRLRSTQSNNNNIIQSDDIWNRYPPVRERVHEEDSETTRSHKNLNNNDEEEEVEEKENIDAIMNTDIEEFDVEDLKATIQNLRTYARTSLKEKLRSEIMNEVIRTEGKLFANYAHFVESKSNIYIYNFSLGYHSSRRLVRETAGGRSVRVQGAAQGAELEAQRPKNRLRELAEKNAKKQIVRQKSQRHNRRRRREETAKLADAAAERGHKRTTRHQVRNFKFRRLNYKLFIYFFGNNLGTSTPQNPSPPPLPSSF